MGNNEILLTYKNKEGKSENVWFADIEEMVEFVEMELDSDVIIEDCIRIVVVDNLIDIANKAYKNR